MNGRDDGTPAGNVRERMTREFIGIKTISVHALVIRFAHKFPAIFHYETIIHARVIIWRQRQVIIVQFSHQLITQVFFKVRRLIEARLIHGLRGDDEDDGNATAEDFAVLFRVITFVRGVLRQCLWPDAAVLKGVEDGTEAMVRDFRVARFPDEPGANDPFRPALLHD